MQRTNGLADTLKKYGYLTQSINQYYRSLDPEKNCVGGCPPFDKFIKMCEELDKMTVSDVFAIQLMQVYIIVFVYLCAFSFFILLFLCLSPTSPLFPFFFSYSWNLHEKRLLFSGCFFNIAIQARYKSQSSWFKKVWQLGCATLPLACFSFLFLSFKFIFCFVSRFHKLLRTLLLLFWICIQHYCLLHVPTLLS